MGIMKVLFLGSGTSTGVPVIGCKCAVCRSDDPKNKRLRSSILVTTEENGVRNILVDTTTDLRFQALANGIERVDAVLFTHAHADHIHGIDDLRTFNHIQGESIPCYGNADTMETIRQKFSYIFDGSARRDWIPRLGINIVSSEFLLHSLKIIPLRIYHGDTIIFGYRINDVSYLTDCNGMPDDTMALIKGTKLLILDATRYQPHAKHYGLEQALAVIEELKPERAILTHLSHAFDHSKVNGELPSGIELAYDGMEII